MSGHEELPQSTASAPVTSRPTRALAEFAASLSWEAIPAATRERVKDVLLDALASALAGAEDADAGKVLSTARTLMGEGQSTAIGGGRLSQAGATVVNGYLITAVSLCDIHYPTMCHVTPEVVPPALAVAERRGASGRDLLTAIAAGLELTTRIGLGTNYPAFHARGWHTPGITGVFGAAAAAGLLLGLDAPRLNHALGIAGSQAAGSHAQHGTPTIKFHQARAALGGLLAAQLAADGFTAMSEVLAQPGGGLYFTHSDGGDPAAALAGLGSRWELENLSLRPWPLATLLLNLVGTVLELVVREDIRPEAVQRVRVSLSPAAYAPHGTRPFDDPAGARASARYLATVVLHDRRCGSAQFSPERLADQGLGNFARERVEIVGDPLLSAQEVQVEISQAGRPPCSLHRRVAHGDARDPLTRGEIVEKFRTAAAPVLSAKSTAAALALVETLERQPTIQPLLAALCR